MSTITKPRDASMAGPLPDTATADFVDVGLCLTSLILFS
jgi:hypothetical protein